MRTQENSSPITGIIWVLLLLLGLIFIPYVWKFWIRSYPSTTHLAKQYLQAVVDSDENQAVHLADFSCKESVRNDAREDIHRFGGAEVRNVIIKVERGTGSDAEVEFAWVAFEYRKNSQAIWQHGKVSITTDFEGIGLRHLFCGG